MNRGTELTIRLCTVVARMFCGMGERRRHHDRLDVLLLSVVARCGRSRSLGCWKCGRQVTLGRNFF